jgi:hypothetical protein
VTPAVHTAIFQALENARSLGPRLARCSRVPMRLDAKTRWGLYLVSIGGIGLAVAMSAGACGSQPTSLNGTGASGAGGASGSGAAPNQGKQLFDMLEPTLYASCGPMCHEAGGIADAPFLAGPDRYQSITSWPGIIVKDATQSKLETYPVSGPQHPYKKLDQPPLDTTLFPQVKAWLAAEAAGIDTMGQPDAGTPFVQPFVPIMGFNAVYLTPFGMQFTGMAITFNADTVGGALELSDIEVHPTSAAGLHIVHPLFAVNPVGKPADPDPVDSFSNVDQVFPAGQSMPLSPGTLILTNWVSGAKLSLAFEKVEIVVPSAADAGPEGGTSGCKSMATFTSDAKQPLMDNCVMCHGGANAAAQGAIDMSKLGSDPAAACAQVRNRVSPANPPASQIFITTDPAGNAAHPYKFGGSNTKFGAFKTSLSMWIQAEN